MIASFIIPTIVGLLLNSKCSENHPALFFLKSYFHTLIKFQEDAAGLILRKAAAHGWIFSLLLSYWNYLKKLKLSLSIFLVLNSGKALVSFALVR